MLRCRTSLISRDFNREAKARKFIKRRRPPIIHLWLSSSDTSFAETTDYQAQVTILHTRSRSSRSFLSAVNISLIHGCSITRRYQQLPPVSPWCIQHASGLRHRILRSSHHHRVPPGHHNTSPSRRAFRAPSHPGESLDTPELSRPFINTTAIISHRILPLSDVPYRTAERGHWWGNEGWESADEGGMRDEAYCKAASLRRRATYQAGFRVQRK
jgi:hypothetical protein